MFIINSLIYSAWKIYIMRLELVHFNFLDMIAELFTRNVFELLAKERLKWYSQCIGVWS